MRLNFGADYGDEFQDDEDEDYRPYKQWYAMSEPTVAPSEDDERYRWPIELASPILPYDQDLG